MNVKDIRYEIRNFFLKVFLGLGYLLKRRGIPIIAYHSIDESNSYLSISPRIFSEQMDYLKRSGWKVISFKQLMQKRFSGNKLQDKTIVITFDDGLENFFTSAWPILRIHQFNATVFVPTDYIGQKAWWYSEYNLKPVSVMNWHQLKQLAAHGIDIQAHGCSHRQPDLLTIEDIEHEIQDSKNTLEKGLSKPVDFFCFPFGKTIPAMIGQLKKSGYRGAIGGKEGLFRYSDDPYDIERQSLDYISNDDSKTALLSIKSCLVGTFAWYVNIKKNIMVVLKKNRIKKR